ncbi:MAG: dTDP-4-amino-4,6-dideoxygalactose transaminase [Colwellia sp.]|jgi:dTDP-4-amino-4,6-dideoxygalactose transaminase
MIPLNKPYLPSFDKYQKYLTRMYDNVWLTNNGPLVQELATKLKDYLGVKHILLTCNGTMALQIAYQALKLTGNAVTTPYTFIATSNSLDWLGLHTKFSDVDETNLNLCAKMVVDAIDNETSAIVPVHVYGNPCDVEAFDTIGKQHNLKIIYDAAHAFGIKKNNRSILTYGDASILSFHATKLFHTLEGGAVIFNNEDDFKRAERMINFGIHTDTGDISRPGTNGKMSEAHAAMGLAMLEDIDFVLTRRREHFEQYTSLLSDIVTMPVWDKDSNQNYAYLPIIFDTAEQCSDIFNALEKNSIQARRYFSPSLNTLSHLNDGQEYQCPISESFATRTLCLPLYFDLTAGAIQTVCKVILCARR